MSYLVYGFSIPDYGRNVVSGVAGFEYIEELL